MIDELFVDPKLIGDIAITDVDCAMYYKRVTETWQEAAFSDMPDHTLVRYFYHQLEGISNLSDTLSNSKEIKDFENVQCGLLLLIDHMRLYYSPYFDLKANAPLSYSKRNISQLTESIEVIRKSLQTVNVNSAFKIYLLKWLVDISETGGNVQYSFRSLYYLEYLIRQIQSINLHSEDAENRLIILLSRSNFNHLAFFVYLQSDIRNSLISLPSTEQQMDYMHQQRAAILSCPEVKNLVYDDNWPSLKIMMSEWLHEEIRLIELTISKEREARPAFNIQKLPLDLPVSQLACLIRLFFEESKFATENLKVIFSFFAANYQTKRQPVISPGSLSKEFYSIDQQTAARVRDLLQKMVLRINRNFFPIVVAIGIAIHVYPGMR